MKNRAFNISIITIIVSISYMFGIATGHYQLFPFDLLFNIKQEIGITHSKRNFDVSSLQEVEIDISNKTGIYLTYGQSNAVNHGQIGYDVKNEVYQFLDNAAYIYEDPSLGGTGNGGSVWGMLGDKLIERGVHNKVIFSNNGWQGKSIEELKKPPYFTYLTENYQQLKTKYGRVDAILFHQGEINHKSKRGNENYYSDFKDFLRNLKDQGIELPIYLSRASICNTESDSALINIQNRIIEDFDFVFKGPNTDLLSEKKYRLPDYCHFSMLGYEEFSDMWVELLAD